MLLPLDPAFLFCFLSAPRRGGLLSFSPILAGLYAFFADRTAARIAPVSPASSSMASFRLLARLDSPENLSRLGYEQDVNVGQG